MNTRESNETSAQGKRMLRVLLSQRQDRLLKKLKKDFGVSESELVRRALDDFFRTQIERGDLKDE